MYPWFTALSHSQGSETRYPQIPGSRARYPSRPTAPTRDCGYRALEPGIQDTGSQSVDCEKAL